MIAKDWGVPPWVVDGQPYDHPEDIDAEVMLELRIRAVEAQCQP